jgi:peptide/nickel transport system substrate-binding protein
MRSANAIGVAIALVTLLAGCAGPAPNSGGSAPPGERQAAGPKRITAAIHGDPHTLFHTLNPASRVRGIETLEQLVNAGLALVDKHGNLQPQLAEQVPSLENGRWILLPDGGMQTTWRIRDGAQWHDGTPVTAEDMLFTLQVAQDKELPIFNNAAYDLIDTAAAPDPRTVVLTWKQAFVEADTMFTTLRALPIPKHLLERAYREDKVTFTDHPYWSTEFVGTGPFKLKEWERSSHLIFEANDHYVLGRPKIDLVEVRFITDDNTLAASLLAGAVELTLGRSLSGEQALEVRQQWRDGNIDLSYENWIAMFPQFLNPNPAIITEVRFRRALMHAMDRQQLIDAFQPGLTTVAHSWLSPNQPDYREIEERNLVRYDYDVRRANQLLESLELAKGSDGFYRDRAGQRLNVETRTTADDDVRQKTLFAIADYWQQAGIGVETVLIPRQRAADLEYRATFPAFELVRQPQDVRGLRSFHSRYTALPENSFRVTGNRTRYQNQEWDALVDRYFMTIPKQERMELMGQVVRHISDQVLILGIFYNVSPTLFSNRLLNVGAAGQGATQAWNAHLWDVRT